MSLAELPIVEPDVQPTRGGATSVECLDSSTVLYLHGELDLSTLDEEHRAMSSAISQETPLIVDLSAVRFMDSTTIRLLMRSADFVQARGRSFTIRRPPPFVARLLTICGLDDLVVDGPLVLLAVADRAGP
jgi:anti-anti-sigma factor